MQEYNLFSSVSEKNSVYENTVYRERLKHLCNFLKLDITITQRYIDLFTLMWQGLDNGNLAVELVLAEWKDFINTSSPQIIDIYLYSQQKNWKISQKIIVLVVIEEENKILAYFQKQWNTYIHLYNNMQKWFPILEKKISPFIEQDLNNLMSHLGKQLNQEQKNAVISAVNGVFSLITGGPGTGKTTVVGFIIQAIIHIHPQAKIKILAPTGRASARLKESLSNLLNPLTEENSESLYTPQTIHSFIGHIKAQIKDSLNYYQNLYIQADVVIIDEISMVSPSLFSQLLGFIKPGTKLILLGDPHQLPSVEEGFLLGYFLSQDSMFKSYHYTLKQLVRSESSEISQLINYIQEIEYSQEQKLDFLNSIIQYKTPQELEKLYHSDEKGVFFIELSNEKEESIKEILNIYYQKYKQNHSTTEEILSHIYKSQLLTPTKKGNLGINFINQHCFLKHLYVQELIYYPAIITKNISYLGLYNGDLGYFLIERGIEKGVVFLQNGIEKIYSRDQIKYIDYAFGMTVHKSQGSEFEEIWLFLPSYSIGQLFSQEVFYTGISRAKKRVILIGTQHTLKQGLGQKNLRYNGLPILVKDY